ncbi:Dihydroorotase [Ascobolus immersus RN42]|uniref:dihydroorotase n=1 Tax=Ascobolus immersus RN42 TaxID=1160509 RepID=A0A3N4ILU1_ASCIM|nr:Dihydroorotase [Ascobolus immersus RN42]
MVVELELPAAADFHVHLRDGELMKTVVPTIRNGGVNLVYVMPNLVPPVTSVARALSYKADLEAIDPSITYLMTLYLCNDVTPEVIYEAKKAGIAGVKSYPAGVTTNSDAGVVSYEAFYPVFAAMEEVDMVLNLHGETPPREGVTVLNAEETFLPTLLDLNKRFPKLRIVLEHCTTAAAVEAVKKCGPTVAATITAHHLYLTIDQWAGNPHCFCKPVAKLPSDRDALVAAAVSGDPKFFLGTDSAPHPRSSKQGSKTAAGVFTQPYALQYVAEVFQREGKLDGLKAFACEYGRAFYKTKELGFESDERVAEKLVIRTEPSDVVIDGYGDGDSAVVPFLAGQKVWSLQWKQ